MATYGISGSRAGLGSVFVTAGSNTTTMVSDVGAVPDPSAAVSVSVTGVSGTGAVGTPHVEIDKSLTGIQATASVGFLGTAGFMVGAQVSGQVGSFTPSITAGITGVSSTGQAGNLVIHTAKTWPVSSSRAGLVPIFTPVTNSLDTYMVSDVGVLEDTTQQNVPNTTSISTASLTLTPQAFTASLLVSLTPNATLTLTAQAFTEGELISLTPNATLSLTPQDFTFDAATVVSLTPNQTLTLTPQDFVVDASTIITLTPDAPLILTPQAFTWQINIPVIIDQASLILDAIPFTVSYVPPFLHMTQEGLEAATVGDTYLRETQTSIEASIVGQTDLHQTQTSIETSISSPAEFRQTQTSVETSTGINNVPFKVTQLAIEVMRGFPTTQGWNADNVFITPVYPTLLGLAFDVKRDMFFHTVVQPQISGKEVRVGSWSQATYAYELVYEMLRDWPELQEYRLLQAFWEDQIGMQGVFLFDDPDDDQRIGQIIDIGDGKQTQYQLKRTFGSFDDYIFAPNVLSAVYLDGILQDGTTYDLTYWGSNLPGVLAFHAAVPVGFTITIDFTYYWPCHFTEDTNTFEKFMYQLWEDKSVKFETIKSNNVLLLPYPENFTNAQTVLYMPSNAIDITTFTYRPLTLTPKAFSIIQGITAPAQAASAGFNTLVFSDDFTSASTIFPIITSTTQSGVNWYCGNVGGVNQPSPTAWEIFPSTTASGISNGNTGGGSYASPFGGIWKIKGIPEITFNQNFQTVSNSQTGPHAWKHMYWEAYIQFNDTQSSPGGWPAWWSWPEDVSGSPVGAEVDLMEAGFTNIAPIGSNSAWTIHDPPGSGTVPATGNMQPLVDSNWHVYGCLWQSTGVGTGTLDFYFDNTHVGGPITTGTGGTVADMESGIGQFLVLGTGVGIPIYVDWVRVWQ